MVSELSTVANTQPLIPNLLSFFSFEYIKVIFFASHWLAMSNSCCNPFIYALLSVRRSICWIGFDVEKPSSFFQEKFNEELKKKATFKEVVQKICSPSASATDQDRHETMEEEEIPMMTLHTPLHYHTSTPINQATSSPSKQDWIQKRLLLGSEKETINDVKLWRLLGFIRCLTASRLDIWNLSLKTTFRFTPDIY